MSDLKAFTIARVSLGRAGNAIAIRDVLDFRLAHARARDAVHAPFHPAALACDLEAVGLETLVFRSAARDRSEYLRRPDLGRRLDDESRRRLEQPHRPFDLVLIAADGLSPTAVQNQAVPLIQAVSTHFGSRALRVAPIVIVSGARVALSDEIGSLFGADLAVMMIGERPGLSAADSMGVYLTWAPQPGRTDAERNCISNIRPDGLSIGAAAELLLLLIQGARRLRISGVGLKVDAMALPAAGHVVS